MTGRTMVSAARLRRVGILGASAALASVVTLAGPAPAVAPPGPNGLIAFETSRDGNAEVYVMNADGTAATNLTNNKASDVDPSWSPDSSLIAFSSTRADAPSAKVPNAEVYVMNADGTGVTRLTFASGEDRGTSWTTDGKIVFHSGRLAGGVSHGFDVYIMDADGQNQTNLTPDSVFADSAADACGDSVTGKIVFNSNRDTTGDGRADDFEIYSMNMDGSGVVQLTDNTTLDSGPVWSPDCSMIAFNQQVGNQLDLFVMNADGSGLVNITNNPAFDAFAAWSPDGTTILFSSNRNDADFELYTVPAAGGTPTRLTNVSGADLRPYWGSAAPIPVIGPPATKDACKDGAWKLQNNPRFRNQGQCVAYFNAITDRNTTS